MGNKQAKKVNSIGRKKKNFYFRFGEKSFCISGEEKDSVSLLVKEFKKRSKCKNLNLSFYSNAEKLEPEMKINQLVSTQIFVDEKENVIGGFSTRFTDVSKQIHEQIYFSDKAPPYRIVTQGINIFGICKGKTCQGYKKEVICPLKKVKKYDLIKEKDDLECPLCKGTIIPKTLGFHLCKYKIKGKKYQNNEIIPFEFENKAENKNSIQYYSPEKNGEEILIELIIEITEDL